MHMGSKFKDIKISKTIINDKSLGIVGRLLLLDIHVGWKDNENNRRVCFCQQPTTFESLTGNMTY